MADVDNNNNNNVQQNNNGSTTNSETKFLLDNLDLFDYDKRGYHHIFIFGVIPKNTVLVKRGPTGSWKIKDYGLKGVSPIGVGMRLDMRELTVNFRPKLNLHTLDHHIVPMADFYVNIRLDNPLVFAQEDYNHKDDQRVLHRLNLLIDSLITRFIASHAYDDVISIFSSGFTLNDLDPGSELNDFKERYGVEVTRIKYQNLQEPKKIAEQANARADEAIRSIRRQTETDDAIARANITREEGRAEADVRRMKSDVNIATARGYMDAGMRSDEVARVLQTGALPEGSTFFGNIGPTNQGSSMDMTQMMMYNNMMMQQMMRNGMNPQVGNGVVNDKNGNSVLATQRINQLRSILDKGISSLSPGSDVYERCRAMLLDLNNPNTISWYGSASDVQFQNSINYYNNLIQQGLSKQGGGRSK